MTKIAVHTSFGGFALTKECYKEMNVEWDDFGHWNKEDQRRDDPRLINAIEKLGEDSSQDGDVEIIEIPDGVDWVICGYDGKEWVAEKHRTWGDRH